MIRRSGIAFLGLLLFLFPLTLSSQSSDRHPASSGHSSPGGCVPLIAAEASGGGSPAADDKSASHGFDLANLDRAVSPCEDFDQFANGGWKKNNPIPPDRSSWGSFNKLKNNNDQELRQILEEAAKDKAAKPGSNWQKIGDFYASCMDESQIESAGLKPLEPELARIEAMKNTSDLQAEIGHLHHIGVNVIFDFSSEQDLKDSTQVIAGAGQGGLGMPDRQYYVDDDDRSKQLRAGYVQHVTNMFKLMGDSDATAAADAKTVLSVETSLANASKKREDLRDPETNYHVMTLAQLDELTPQFSWASYFREVGAPPLKSADIGQPEFFKQADADLASVPLADWKVYLRWQLIHSVAGSLPAKFVDESFNFYGRTLTGAQQLLPRWERCTTATDTRLGEALGQYYVQRYFPPEAKARALEMVHNLIAALHEDLTTLDWMSPATRQLAIVKLQAINLKIGYPDKWRDYSAYAVDHSPYVQNVLRGKAFEEQRDLGKIGKPVDRNEWGMTPPTVNAYYNPTMNEIVFPAGILQPPFFDFHADDALNYGGMGAVIGHEMTHGFDDQGAKFDAQGNLHNWWTAEDLKNFQARGDCIASQFSAFEVEPGLHGNGKLEEGESIADLGGLTISHAAYEKTLEGKPAPPVIDGFTGEQRFFLGWAQVWASNTRIEGERLQAKTNEHPLDRFRVDGPFSNMPSFAKAYSCPADSKMVRPEGQRCRIW